MKYRKGNISLFTCHDGCVSNLFDPHTHPRSRATVSVGISIMPFAVIGTIYGPPRSSMVAMKYRTGKLSLSTCHDGGVSNLPAPQTSPRRRKTVSVGISIMPWLLLAINKKVFA